MFKGEDIKRKRKASRMSAEALATLLKVSKENIYKWEKGTRPNNAEDYLKVENWLNGKLENVPQKTVSSGNIEKDSDSNKDDKYLKLLEDNDKFFKELVKSNLAGLLIGQRSIQANIEAGFQYSLHRESGGDQAKEEEMLQELDRRIGEKMGVKPGRDNSAGM